MEQLHTYIHDAMKTTFTLRLRGSDKSLCDSVAQAAITLIDEIEHSLSRYIEGSEAWQINHMQAGETLILSDLCYECLQYALHAYVQTDGLFDITLGTQIEHRKNAHDGVAPALCGQLMVDPDRPAIHCAEPGREIDLGGIGKGFALDKMRSVIEEMGIESALLSAGASTQLAFGEEAWEIELRGDNDTLKLSLQNQALSASGTSIQGSHIISPRDSHTNYQFPRLWLTHSSATMADAFSTAVLLMNEGESAQITGSIDAIYFEKDGAISSL
ncbi:MAG: FAD:protein FMN transferase [Opitutales bacterium]|jgi:FAD:protein FMN transferase|nr:FAD:protein FMN transferase [Opitutales bacterium]MDP4644530.1 FAD:protein FMN transferase [Opitutales bacterium]